jgi:transposase
MYSGLSAVWRVKRLDGIVGGPRSRSTFGPSRMVQAQASMWRDVSRPLAHPGERSWKTLTPLEQLEMHFRRTWWSRVPDISGGTAVARRNIWAGLDVGAVSTSLCVIDDNGEVLQETACDSNLATIDREIRWLRRRRHARVALEAATGSHLARGLRSRGYTVDLYEARKLSKFLRVRRNKTDANDAAGIAEVGRLGPTVVSKVHLKSLECQMLQSRLTIRRHLIRQRVAAVNLLCRQLEHYGGRVSRSTRSKQLRNDVEAEIKKLFGKSPNALTAELHQLLAHCERLISYQLRVDGELMRLARETDACRRFMTIPGVGTFCALTFYAAVSEPHRFSHSKNIGAYLGLTPNIHQSGLTSRYGRVSKMGSKAARAMLVGASKSFMKWAKPEDPLLNWVTAVETRSGRRKARIALARKIAVIMLAMWKSGSCYQFQPCPLRTAQRAGG